MKSDLDYKRLDQPQLFEWGETSLGVLELFPAVWQAAESLTSLEVSERRAGLEALEKVDAARLSPLIAYLLATRISEPSLELRFRVVDLLAATLEPDEQGRPCPDDVRVVLMNYLMQMRTREILALLQVAEHRSDSAPAVAGLLNLCSYGGRHLGDILENRALPLAIRKQAARFIGQVGYLDALPALQRVAERLETRLNGQQSMGFITRGHNIEMDLLPAVTRAREILTSP